MQEEKSDDSKEPEFGPIDTFDGTFSDVKVEEVANLLFEKLGHRSCEMCDHENWIVSNAYVGPMVLRSNEAGDAIGVATNITAQMVMISCSNCGNSKFFKADLLEAAVDFKGEADG